jgi:hypothetical protein
MFGTYPAGPFRAQIVEPVQNRQLRPDRPPNQLLSSPTTWVLKVIGP